MIFDYHDCMRQIQYVMTQSPLFPSAAATISDEPHVPRNLTKRQHHVDRPITPSVRCFGRSTNTELQVVLLCFQTSEIRMWANWDVYYCTRTLWNNIFLTPMTTLRLFTLLFCCVPWLKQVELMPIRKVTDVVSEEWFFLGGGGSHQRC